MSVKAPHMVTDDQMSRLSDAAVKAGTEAGRSAGSWVEVDGANARFVLNAIESCEFDYPSPLSGEWADGPTPESVMDDVIYESGLWPDVRVSDLSDVAPDLVDAWEMAYSDGYQAIVVERCNYQLEA